MRHNSGGFEMSRIETHIPDLRVETAAASTVVRAD
jgi:hypothetical protein